MKARYIREGRAVNPDFSNKAKRQAQLEGKRYDVPTYLTVPVGHVEEGPLCWTHCCPGHMGEPPMCEPADDECRERVKKWMDIERPNHLESIRVMALPENLKKMPKKKQEHILALAEAYGLIGVTEPIKPKTQDTNAPVPEQKQQVDTQQSTGK